MKLQVTTSAVAMFFVLCATGTDAAETSVLYDNTPGPTDVLFTAAFSPRTGGADEVLWKGPGALITSMQFGGLSEAGGRFDLRIRIWDDIDDQADGVPMFSNLVADLIVPSPSYSTGTFVPGPISLTSLPGGGALVTPNPSTLGAAGITDAYVQLDFYQPDTTTYVEDDGYTYLFDGSGPKIGFTFDSPQVGGPGDGSGELFWGDVDANGIITGEEAFTFGKNYPANFVLRLDGQVVPEPGGLAIITFALPAMLRRRARTHKDVAPLRPAGP